MGQAEDVLRELVRDVDASADVLLGPPGASRSGRGVNLYLLEIVPRSAARGTTRPPLQLWLRYLITTWGEEAGAAQGLLVDLAFAAMEQPELELDPEPLAPEMWSALDATPQPSFLVRVPVSRERPVAPAKPVLLPLRVEPGRIAVVAGVVRDTRETPIADARITVDGFDRGTTTDRRGRFRIAGVPGPPATTQLRVRAKGVEILVPVPDEPDAARTMVINLDPLGREHGIPDA
jgi:hypothetical protein